MTNYSVRYLDALGRTQRSDFLPFENDKTAVDFARIGIVLNAIVEIRPVDKSGLSFEKECKRFFNGRKYKHICCPSL